MCPTGFYCVTTTETGFVPAVAVPLDERVLELLIVKTEIELLPELVTYTKLPDGSTATSTGEVPTVNGDPDMAVRVPSAFRTNANS